MPKTCMSSLANLYSVLFFEALALTFTSGAEPLAIASLCLYADGSFCPDLFETTRDHIGTGPGRLGVMNKPGICMSAIGQGQVHLLPVDPSAHTPFDYIASETLVGWNVIYSGVNALISCEYLRRESRVRRAGDIQSPC